MDYTIKQGDTLSDIAQRYKTTVKKLTEENHLDNPDRIIAGHTLHIDDPQPAAQPTATPTPAPQSQSPAPQPSPPAPAGDTTTISTKATGDLPVYQATNLEDVMRKAQAAQTSQATGPLPTDPPPTPAPTGRVLTVDDAPTPRMLTVNAPAAWSQSAGPAGPQPEAKHEHKNWFDRLVDGGESLVHKSLGRIPLIGGLFNFAGDVVGGALKAAGDMVGGIATAIAHPIKTLEGLWSLAAHIPFSPPNLLHVANEVIHGHGPSDILAEEGNYLKGVWNGLTAGYQQSIADGKYGEVPGRLIVDVGSFLIGAGEVNATAKGVAAAGKVGEALADTGRAAEVVADASKAVEVTADAGKGAEVLADAGKGAQITSDAAKASRLATAVDAFKATSVGRASLDVVAGVQLMGQSMADFAKSLLKSVRESGAKLPPAQIQEAEGLSARAEELARQFQEASKLQGPEALQRMQELSKQASELANQTDKIAGANKGLRGLANGMRERVAVTGEAFASNGVAGSALNIGAMTWETTKAIGNLGLEVGKAGVRAVGRAPAAVVNQIKNLGDGLGALAGRAKDAAALSGEAAVRAYKGLASETASAAAQARQLAAATKDAALAQIATELETRAGQYRLAYATMSMGLPLNAARGGLDALEGAS
jgi:hypothetical protein